MLSANARVAVFISGGGSNLQSLIEASHDGRLEAEIALVVSSRTDAYGLQRAEKAGISRLVFNSRAFKSQDAAAEYLLNQLTNNRIDYIALAGYLKLLPQAVVKAYRHRIANIHPALLPKYGGKGMYGQFVHEAVIANKEKESGVSIHLVDEIYDHGYLLAQAKVPVLPDDTPETLAQRVLVEEHRLYPEVLDKLVKGKYRIPHG